MSNIKSEGCIFDANLVIVTGDTITAGSMIWADISGTNVVRAVRSYSGVTPESNVTLHSSATGRGYASLDTQLGTNTGVFLGVIASTQTGADSSGLGHQTGVTYYDRGVFKFNVTPSSSCKVFVGRSCFAQSWDTIRCGFTGLDAGANLTSTTASGSNTTGLNPIGIVSFIENTGLHTTGATSQVRVKIYPHRTLQSFS